MICRCLIICALIISAGLPAFGKFPRMKNWRFSGVGSKGRERHFFKVLAERFKPLPIIAEDLGEITPDVIELNEKIRVSGHAGIIVRFQRRH